MDRGGDRYLVRAEVECGQVQGACVGGLPVHRHHVAIVTAQGVPHPGPQRENKRCNKKKNRRESGGFLYPLFALLAHA